MLMGQSGMAQQLKQQAVGQAYEELTRRRAAKAAQVAAQVKHTENIRKAALEREKFGLEKEKVGLEKEKLRISAFDSLSKAAKRTADVTQADLDYKLRKKLEGKRISIADARQVTNARRAAVEEKLATATIDKDWALEDKLLSESTILDMRIDTFERLSKDPNIKSFDDIPVSDKLILGLKQIKPGKDGKLTVKQQADISAAVAKAEDEIHFIGMDDPKSAGYMNYVNEFSNNPYIYFYGERPGDVFGKYWTEPGGIKVDLPVVNGKQLTSADIIKTSKDPKRPMSVEAILKKLGAI